MCALLGACTTVPQTGTRTDASLDMTYHLGLTTRHADPIAALAGVSVWVDGEERVMPIGMEVVGEILSSPSTARTHIIELRFEESVLDRLFIGPGDTCALERGANNPLRVESVNLCLRSNGEIQINDFSCEYDQTGFFTADVFCPTDCHPLLGRSVCGRSRCGLLLTHTQPRFGVLGCVAIGELSMGDACEEPAVGQADACGVGGVCFEGACRKFCLGGEGCEGTDTCVPALGNPAATPLVCIPAVNAALPKRVTF